jgi:hypothetical protein
MAEPPEEAKRKLRRSHFLVVGWGLLVVGRLKFTFN